ncbi:MAG: DUF3313 domain-containing protein [Deltaproteobacteria bacterium]|nr:DUF3313 domain-containing protein [Deltaproteobacteria bacterium]
MKKRLLVPLAILSCLLAGCAGKQLPQKPQPSGFLGGPQLYSAMSRDRYIQGGLVYRATPRPAPMFDSYIVPPVSIHLNAEGQARDISKDDLNELAEQFRSEVIVALGSRYQVIDVPASGVGILRMAITDAYPNTVLMNLPVIALLTGGAYGGASLEAELVDSVSGSTVAALMVSDSGQNHSFTSSMTKWGETDAVLRDWAKLIAYNLDQPR